MNRLFKPQSARRLAEYLTNLCNAWDASDPSNREEMVNPDEPMVLCVPNPAWDGNERWHQDDEGRPYTLSYHVQSIGGGSDTDENGRECGHDGAQIVGQAIAADEFLGNGRRVTAPLAPQHQNTVASESER